MPGDIAQVAPDVYKVVLENERVRVLDTRTAPGGTSQMHHHPDMVGYAVSDCSWDLTSPEGETVRVGPDKAQKGLKSEFIQPSEVLGMPNQHEGQIDIGVPVLLFRSRQGIDQLAAGALVEIRLPGMLAK